MGLPWRPCLNRFKGAEGAVASIRRVAELAGVSVGTVSHVLNGTARVRPETAERVRRAIAALEFEPNALARSLSTQRSTTIGVALTHLSSPFNPELIEEILLLAGAQGYSVIVAPPPSPRIDLSENLALLRRQRVAGIIAGGGLSDQLARTLARRHIPTVLIEPDSLEVGLPAILFDWDGGLQAAVGRLKHLGHTRIGLAGGPAEWGTARRRVEAFRAALAAHGLPCHEALVALDDFGFAAGHRAGLTLLRRSPRPTAIIGAHDPIAIGVIRAAADLGLRVPADLSVVGIDTIALSGYLLPALTSLDIPRRTVAALAVETLLAGVRGEAMPAVQKVPLTLVERESIGPAPHLARPQRPERR